MCKICVEENESSYEQGKNRLGFRKALAINWDIEKDLFVLNFDEIIQLKQNLTKFVKNQCNIFWSVSTYFTNITSKKAFIRIIMYRQEWLGR